VCANSCFSSFFGAPAQRQQGTGSGREGGWGRGCPKCGTALLGYKALEVLRREVSLPWAVNASHGLARNFFICATGRHLYARLRGDKRIVVEPKGNILHHLSTWSKSCDLYTPTRMRESEPLYTHFLRKIRMN
jgi:hypothetical protein